jgi:hypothetical protein
MFVFVGLPVGCKSKLCFPGRFCNQQYAVEVRKHNDLVPGELVVAAPLMLGAGSGQALRSF